MTGTRRMPSVAEQLISITDRPLLGDSSRSEASQNQPGGMLCSAMTGGKDVSRGLCNLIDSPSAE